MGKINKAILWYVSAKSQDGVLGFQFKYNRYYGVRFTVLVDGQIGKEVTVFSFQDTSNSLAILGAIKQTNGNWINNSGKELSVYMPIEVQYIIDGTDPIPLLPIAYREYHDGGPADLVSIPPIIIQQYPPVAHYRMTSKGNSK
jgi:hypothetical protein